MKWLQLTKDDGPVLIDLAKVAYLKPSRGILGKGDKCSLHFAGSDNGMGDLSSITVEESYDEVAAALHALLNPRAATAPE